MLELHERIFLNFLEKWVGLLRVAELISENSQSFMSPQLGIELDFIPLIIDLANICDDITDFSHFGSQ